jgi:hypothetical protein
MRLQCCIGASEPRPDMLLYAVSPSEPILLNRHAIIQGNIAIVFATSRVRSHGVEGTKMLNLMKSIYHRFAKQSSVTTALIWMFSLTPFTESLSPFTSGRISNGASHC